MLRAPGRGRYARGVSAGDRTAAQRERLLAATARAFVESELSVARIVALAGVGRASFYELFDDARHALFTVRQQALMRAARALRDSRDLPSTRAGLEALCHVWLASVARDPHAALAALDARMPELSPLVELFGRALSAWVVRDDSRPRDAAPPPPLALSLSVAQMVAARLARDALTPETASALEPVPGVAGGPEPLAVERSGRVLATALAALLRLA